MGPALTEEVAFKLTDEDFSLVNSKGVSSLVKGEWTVQVGELRKPVLIQ